jgi:diguanylate cyclase (GGDEF)-like protein
MGQLDVAALHGDRQSFAPIPDPPSGEIAAADYLRGVQLLVRVVQELSLVKDMEGLQKIVRTAARELTGADGATFVLRDGDQCFYVDEDAIEPLWKGSRFPMDICVSGWVMLNREPAVIEDIFADPRVPHDAYRPTFVKSLATVPIRTRSPIGAIGNFWAHKYKPTAHQVALLQALADTTAVALENLQVYGELEERVRDRTAELEARTEDVRRLSITDELTGLNNRRGFIHLAERQLSRVQGGKATAVLGYFDLDGLKQANDNHGHEVGDRMIAEFAQALRESFRHDDILGRIGGDEFCVLSDGADGVAPFEGRLEEILALYNGQPDRPYRLAASAGWVTVGEDGVYDLDQLLAVADARMYAAKRARRRPA